MVTELVALLKCWNVTGFTVDGLKLAKTEAEGNSNDLAVVERLSMVKGHAVGVTEGKPFSEEVPSPLPS